MKAVVGAAIVRSGRVLATRRTAPLHAAGRWEFPGGKVELGERPSAALEREIAEELSCTIEVTGWLSGSVPIDETHVLTVATARILDGEPEPTEHDQARWLAAEELGEVDWLQPDRPFLAELAGILRQSAGGVGLRAIVFEENDALALQRQLRRDGFSAEIERERLAGEDDDEDHPWAVVTDAPEAVVELHLDEYDGWLDAEVPPSQPSPPLGPLELPAEPRRLKRP